MGCPLEQPSNVEKAPITAPSLKVVVVPSCASIRQPVKGRIEGGIVSIGGAMEGGMVGIVVADTKGENVPFVVHVEDVTTSKESPRGAKAALHMHFKGGCSFVPFRITTISVFLTHPPIRK